MTAIKDHPASVMYYIADEPHTASCSDAVQQIRARSQLVTSIDPTASTNHPELWDTWRRENSRLR